jgi:hypothetical protein
VLPDPESERGGPPQATPEVAKEEHHQHFYHISLDVQAFLTALSPLWFALVLALCVRGSR